MAYDGKVMREALQRFEEDKQRRASQAAARRQRIYREVPRLEEIEQQLRGTMGRIMRAAACSRSLSLLFRLDPKIISQKE